MIFGKKEREWYIYYCIDRNINKIWNCCFWKEIFYNIFYIIVYKNDLGNLEVNENCMNVVFELSWLFKKIIMKYL